MPSADTNEPAALVVTTSIAATPELESQARHAADELSAPFAARRSITIARLLRETGAKRLLIVMRDCLLLHDSATGISHGFHPNLVPVRVYNLAHGGNDTFIEAAGLKSGDSLLDCTLGFAAEATLGALTVGTSGRVIGLESIPELALVTREGLRHFSVPSAQLREAMRRIEVKAADYQTYLPQCATNAFDVVYFDPFFGERLPGSENSVSPLALFGDTRPLDAASVQEARRVARRRVVVKHPKHEPLPDALTAAAMETIAARKSRIVYSVFSALPEVEMGRDADGEP